MMMMMMMISSYYLTHLLMRSKLDHFNHLSCPEFIVEQQCKCNWLHQ